MQAAPLRWVTAVQEGLLSALLRLSSAKLSASPRDSAEVQLSENVLQCLFSWGQRFAGSFEAACEYLRSCGVNSENLQAASLAESGNLGFLDRALRVKTCKTEVLSASNNEEVLLFAVEGDVERLCSSFEESLAETPEIATKRKFFLRVSLKERESAAVSRRFLAADAEQGRISAESQESRRVCQQVRGQLRRLRRKKHEFLAVARESADSAQEFLQRTGI